MRRALLDLATAHPDRTEPVHWGYLGDASFIVKNWKDSNLAYLHLLFSDPHAADLTTLKHPDLRETLDILKADLQDDVLACALWPFSAWQNGVLEIPPGNTFLLSEIQQQRSLLGSSLVLDRVQRLRQFFPSLAKLTYRYRTSHIVARAVSI